MINILRLRHKDIEWGSRQSEDYYLEEFYEKYGQITTLEELRRLNGVQILDYARLKIASYLSSDRYKNDYFNICLDNERQSFVVSFDGLERDMAEVLGEAENITYLPIQKLFLNQNVNDPYVHYDEKCSVFSLPANVFMHNTELLEAIGLTKLGFSSIDYSEEIEDLLHYDEERKIWVYSLTGVVLGVEYFQYKKIWNYATDHSIEDSKNDDGLSIVAYDEDGVTRGEVTIVTSFKLEDLVVVKKGEQGIKGIISGTDYNFNQERDIEGELLFIYVSEPTDGFLLVAGGLNGKNSLYIPISVQFGDNERIMNRLVFTEDDECLYIPITSVNLEVFNKLHTLGFSWSKEDRDSMGIQENGEAKREILNDSIGCNNADSDDEVIF